MMPKRERIPDCIFQYPYSHQLLLCLFVVVLTNLFISYGSHHRKEKSSPKGPVCMMTDEQLKQNSLSCKLQSDRCCLIRKCKCASTYLEELSIQFFCHKNTWKREELHLEELFSRYPPVLRIQFLFCYLRHSDQPPDPSSASLMKKLCNLIAAVIVYAFISSSLMFSYKCRGVSSAFSAFYEKARFVRTC
ncbi:hypothetical protein CY35_02G020700 [Sphagnum magellanicum]|nr:hypothetical protein CY35_02G020700 [Sphagnum magellanicum]